jgi:hypothetical protein
MTGWRREEEAAAALATTLFCGKFSIWIFFICFLYGVFELSLLRNTQKFNKNKVGRSFKNMTPKQRHSQGALKKT